MKNNELCLNGYWNLYIIENNLCSHFADDIKTASDLNKKGIAPINGSVPGNFELDMNSAGLIDEPYFGLNVLDMQKLENRHLWYSTGFKYSGNSNDEPYLHFCGIDTFADIYLNGIKIGKCDNMLIEYDFNATGIINGENELLIHIKPTCIEARKYRFDMDVTMHLYYNAASLGVRKAAHSFGWDIFPRIVSGGIWRDVYIRHKKKDYIEDIFLSTISLKNETAHIAGYFTLSVSDDFITNYGLRIKGICRNSEFNFYETVLWHTQGNISFDIENPLLWWPRDAGEQNLYSVKAELLKDGNVVDCKEFNFGVRIVKLLRSDICDENSGEFCFMVNGERIFIRGTNWVPCDAFHSRDKSRLQNALKLLLDINCNMVRCWGGNVYEDHDFFDFCDKSGILVWQDFAMGCATYPQNTDFAEKIKQEAEFIVRKLRLHTSLALWAGDNECDILGITEASAPRNPESNILTRKIIPEVLSRLDPFREYLPSSPYISPTAYENGASNCLPEDHLWGPRDYFKSDFYTKSTARFASETGYHGCPSPNSLKKFLSPNKVWPGMNDEWLVHSTCMQLESSNGNPLKYGFRNKLMESQIGVLFGEIPSELEEFALASQFSQGEAIKFYIERFRSGKWKRTGLIWWNLIDGWPQFSDAIVDYYYNKKVAYHYIKRSQEPLCIMIKEPENGILSIIAANDTFQNQNVEYTVTDISIDKCIINGRFEIEANSNLPVLQIPYDEKNMHFYLISWEYNGKKSRNHYISGNPPFELEKYIEYLKKADLFEVMGFN